MKRDDIDADEREERAEEDRERRDLRDAQGLIFGVPAEAIRRAYDEPPRPLEPHIFVCSPEERARIADFLAEPPTFCVDCDAILVGGFCARDRQGRWTGPGLDRPTWCPKVRP